MSTLLEVRTTIVLTAVGVDKTLKMWKNKYFPIQYFLIQISSRKKYLTITKLTCGLANNFFFLPNSLTLAVKKEHIGNLIASHFKKSINYLLTDGYTGVFHAFHVS